MAMSKQYSCDLCKKSFKQKIDFTRHQNKKAPCITLTEMQQITQTKEVKTDNKTTLISVFKSIMDILRDTESLVGPKALSTWTPLLILRMIEPHFGGEINIDDYEYDFSHIEDEMIEKHKNKLLEIVRFSNLSNEKEDNIPNLMKHLWDDILSEHPTTKNIFLKGKNISIKNKSTYKKIIDKINSINLNIGNDVLGDAYEEIFKDVMVGKTFGQFFTQPLVKKMMVKLINPQIHPDGKIDTCGDPTMGTGGFLITYLQDILQQANAKNIKPDWDFIKNEGLYGKELDEDTYQLAVSNMLISSGHMFEGLDHGDSIRVPITRKFDNILANPPFGIKGLKYDDFQSPLKSEYVPIKTDNAVSLFIQAIIYMLKINGKCAVVLPDGQDLFSKTNKTLVAIREYLMKTCDLKEIIYLPSGIFTYTTIKTCVFYFVKKREGIDVLKVDIKYSKTTQKETKREYKFSKTHQTTKVKFYDYNPYEDVKNLLIEVPIEKIASNSYSLNYAEYMKDETEEEQYEDGIVVKTLGEVCKFDIGGTPSRSKNDYYENGNNLWVSVRELNGGYIYDTKEKITDLGVQKSSVKLFAKDTILFSFKLSIGKTAIVGNPLYTNEAIAGILSKNNDLLINKYLYYYLTINDFSKLGSGILGNGSLNKKSLKQIKIPIPSLERQQEIVKYLDFIYEKANKTSNEKVVELKLLNEFCLSNQKIFGENVVKTLGEVCKVNQGTYIKPDMKIQGEYPVYGGGNASYYINQSNREDEIIVAKDGVSADCVRYEKDKFFLNHHGWTIICKDVINKKYMFYYLQSIQRELLSIAKGTAQLGINQENFYKLKIPIPSLERQKEIVDYCEYNYTLINQLKKEIENHKKQAQQFITGIVKAQVQTEEPDDTSSVNAEPIDEVQNEIVSIEEEVVIEQNPKVKKVKKTLVIVEEDNEI